MELDQFVPKDMLAFDRQLLDAVQTCVVLEPGYEKDAILGPFLVKRVVIEGSIYRHDGPLPNELSLSFAEATHPYFKLAILAGYASPVRVIILHLAETAIRRFHELIRKSQSKLILFFQGNNPQF